MLEIEFRTTSGAEAEQQMVIQAINNLFTDPAQDIGSTLDYDVSLGRFVLVIYGEPADNPRCEIRLNTTIPNTPDGKVQAQNFAGPLLLALFKSRSGSNVTVVEFQTNDGGGTEIILTAR